MRLALELAAGAALRDEVPVGACLVLNDTLIGSGANAREATSRTVAHAEIMALEDYSRQTGQWRLPPGTTLFVTVEPCVMCTGAMLWARVDTIEFGCSDPRNAGLQRLLPAINDGAFDHRFKEAKGGLLLEDCAATMKNYFRAKRLKSSS